MLSELCVRRPVFATMLVMSLVVLGVFSFRDLGVDLFPKADPAQTGQIGAPIPGVVSTVAVQLGQTVKKGDRLLVMEAMKMQSTVYAPVVGHRHGPRGCGPAKRATRSRQRDRRVARKVKSGWLVATTLTVIGVGKSR